MQRSTLSLSATTSAKREGRIEERNAIVEKMRQKGYTEEQLKELFGDNYNG